MVDEPVSARGTQKADFGATFEFPHVFKAEIDLTDQAPPAQIRAAQIATRTRKRRTSSGEWIWRPTEDANLIGLALSGGGIRSAAFCLGVLQALHADTILQRVDYLSTVSGGGYIGCSLTAALETAHEGGRPQDNFPFASRLMEDEPPALQHVRNYSNYLFPDGAMDLCYERSDLCARSRGQRSAGGRLSYSAGSGHHACLLCGARCAILAEPSRSIGIRSACSISS